MKTHTKIKLALLLSGIFSMSSIANAKMEEVHFTSSANDTTVTALGIEKDKKALPYQIQKVDGSELIRVQDANFVNSLTGRIAGATINASSSGAGGSVRVLMRGARSISGNNGVMYVLDGIPLPQLSTEQPYNIYEGMAQSGDGITTINPQDIESVSVLTGAAASILYGSDAANGVIMITTKKGQAGKLSVNVSNSTTFSSPFVMPEFQNRYDLSWGNKLNTPLNWNPSDFYQTGHTINNSISLSAGSKKNQTYFSAATQNSKGIIPNNDVSRYNISFRNTSNLMKDRLKLDMNFRYTNINEQNMLSQGEYFNPLIPIYLLPMVMLSKDEKLSGHPFKDHYERYDESVGYPVQYWPYDSYNSSIQNPYWTVNRDIFKNKKNRFMGGVGATFAVNNWLNVSARIQYDRDNEKRTRKYYASTTRYLAGQLGSYFENEAKTTQIYSDVMLNANKSIGDFSISATLGASIRDMKYNYSQQGGDLRVANEFTISNLEETASTKYLKDYHDQSKSAFIAAQLGYKNSLYLDLAGRMDWLSFKEKKDAEDYSTDMLYPSAGISVIPTEWFSVKSDVLSFVKLRYSYSEAGSSYQHYIPVGQSFVQAFMGNWKPERTKSHEAGLDASFWGNKINLAFTMYKTVTPDLPIHILRTGGNEAYEYITNDAQIDNKGIELTVGVNQDLGPVRWNSNLTYSINKNKVKYMSYVVNPVTGEETSIESVTVNKTKAYQMRVTNGGSIGDIYVSTLKTDNDGNILIDKNSQTVIPDDEYSYAGNANPDYTIGWANNFAWKGLEIGFVVQARFGGVGVSLTQAIMDAYGLSETSAAARDQGGVWVGNEKIPAYNYYLTTGSNSVGSVYTYDATNIRLAELSVGYNIPVNKWVRWIQGARVSLVGRNLLMFYNKAPFDPESTASTGTFYQGIDYFRQPSLRNMGFAVNLKF